MEGISAPVRAEPVAGQIASAVRKAGRKRNVDARAAEISAALRSEQLRVSPALEHTYGLIVASLVGLIARLNDQIGALERDLHNIALWRAHRDGHGRWSLNPRAGAPLSGASTRRPILDAVRSAPTAA
jgi:hypothetical protein